jgi:glucoamylase
VSARLLSRLSLACALAACAAPVTARAAEAPGAPGERHTWAPADKHGFGTATRLESTVWFTLRAAELTEIYYPDLSTPSFRDLEFAVTDGRTFVDRETDAHVRSEVRPQPGSLTFRQTTQTRRWKLVKTWVTDPRRATVLANVRFESFTRRPLQVYLLADPAPGDDGNDDRGRTEDRALLAWDDTAASAVMAEPRLRRGTSGYAGSASDPRRALEDDLSLDDRFTASAPGNVVQAARTRLTGRRGHREMTLAIGFGADAASARRTAEHSLATGFWRAGIRYATGWSRYLASLNDPPESVRGDRRREQLYDQSLMVLEASEDKLNRGGSIASPTMPWVWGTLELEGNEFSGPYHLVWPRDFYHVATAQKAAGDDEATNRLMDYLWRVQKPDGSWWQNTRVDGRPHWTGLQLDEVALPIVLAWWLGRTSADDWAHVRKAADFVVDNGPRTPQERWENQDGFSPNTIATEIAGLICAADIARRHGDEERATRYEEVADEWEEKVESWTATTNGPYSPKPYYLRLTKDGNPDDGSTYDLGDNFTPNPIDERRVVDQSFLGLALFGVKRHDDATIRNSLAVGDQVLKTETPHGPIWHRFTFDGYGETRTGADWTIFPTADNQTLGRVWPLLSGERGEYELLAGRSGKPYLRTIAGTANDGLMLPEQVWDGRPPTGTRGHELGEGTRSATPLAWTHAQYIRLAWSIDAGTPIERPSIVACRYTQTDC